MRVTNRALILAVAGVGVNLAIAVRADGPGPATTRATAATTTRATAQAALATTAPATRAASTQGAGPLVVAVTTAPATRPATAPAATRPAPDPKVVAAIRDLGADAWKDRQAAQDTLVSFGEEAVPFLRELGNADDGEVRTRAAAAIWQIEQNAQLGGTIVTIKVKDAKPKDVFAEIGRQARCEFPAYPKTLWEQNRRGGQANATISMDLERVPFWTAFKEACTKSGVYPQQIGSDRRLGLSQGSSSYWNGPSVIQGPFLIVANRIYRSDSIDLANPGTVQRDFYLGLSAFVEPKVRVIQSSYNVRLDEAVDDKGNSLVGRDRIGDGMNSGQQWMWNLNARLTYPENPGKTIVRLRGGMRFLVQTRAETLDVPDVLAARNVTKTVANRRVTIKEVKKTGDQYEVQMTFHRDGLAQAEWGAMSYPGYAIRLLDKDGKALASRGWGGGGGQNEMNYNYTFGRNSGWSGEDAAGEPHRLVWEIPTETREMNVEFQFKDLPMP